MESRNLFPAGALCMLVLPGIAWSAPEVIREIYHDTSPPLSSMPVYSTGEVPKQMRIFPLRALPAHPASGNQPTIITDAAHQPPVPLVSAMTGLNFDGVGMGFSGPNGTFSEMPTTRPKEVQRRARISASRRTSSSVNTAKMYFCASIKRANSPKVRPR